MAVCFPPKGDCLRLADALPGDVLVAAEGVVWRCLEGDVEFWYRCETSGGWYSWRQCGNAPEDADRVYGPFRRATAEDVVGIPVDHRPRIIAGACEDGPEATEVALADAFVACLLDATMPVVSGSVWVTLTAEDVRRGWSRAHEPPMDAYKRAGLDVVRQRYEREARAMAAMLAEYQRLVAGEVAHEPRLSPTELAALGRKPLAPADPLGWEVE